MKEQFVTYEVSKQLKELGFKEECLKWYPNSLGHLTGDHIFLQYDDEKDFAYAPLWQQAKQWIWEKHGLYLDIIQIPQEESEWIFQSSICNNETCHDSASSTSPITAEIEAIKKAVEYLHKQI